MQKLPSKGFFKKSVMRNFTEVHRNFTRKHIDMQIHKIPDLFFFDEVKPCRSAASLKMRFQRTCCLPNFAKFVRIPFLQNTTRRLLLIIVVPIALVIKGELASEIVNYDTKTMYQFEPKCNFVRSTLQVKQQVSEAVIQRLQFLKIS